MKKAYFLLLFALFSAPVLAQSVGINTPNPSAAAALDVQASGTAKGVAFPNIALNGVTDKTTVVSPPPGLMVYNTTTTLPGGAGLYFNNGTAAAPAWVAFTKSVQNYHAFDTGGRTTTSATLTQQPGCLVSFVVPAGQTVDVKVDATVGATSSSFGNGTYSTLIAAIYYDISTTNARVTGGGSLTGLNGTGNGSTVTNDVSSTTVTSWITFTGGTHSLALYTARGTSDSNNNVLTIGGSAATSFLAGQIHATVYYR